MAVILPGFTLLVKYYFGFTFYFSFTSTKCFTSVLLLPNVLLHFTSAIRRRLRLIIQLSHGMNVDRFHHSRQLQIR